MIYTLLLIVGGIVIVGLIYLAGYTEGEKSMIRWIDENFNLTLKSRAQTLADEIATAKRQEKMQKTVLVIGKN